VLRLLAHVHAGWNQYTIENIYFMVKEVTRSVIIKSPPTLSAQLELNRYDSERFTRIGPGVMDPCTSLPVYLRETPCHMSHVVRRPTSKE
jgi:hypothetical protein